jgi:hypothetical protein
VFEITRADIEWDRDIVPAIASAVLRALLSAWQSVRPLHERIEQGTRGSGYVPYRRFLFLSPDVSISDEGKVSVIEVWTVCVVLLRTLPSCVRRPKEALINGCARAHAG